VGQITGTFLDPDGKPIPGAPVMLMRLGGPQRFDGPRATTDELGRFKFDALEPGAYSFAFPTDTDDYGEPRVYRPGDTATLRSARLGAGCVITGLVTSSSGEPVIEAPIRAIPVQGFEGGAAPQPFNHLAAGPAALTDDRGIYRIWGIPPGSYLVSAGGKSFQNWAPPGPYDEDVPTYYPSGSLADAKVVQVANGQEAAGIDIKYIGDAGHRITGAIRFVNPVDRKNGGVVVSLVQAATGRVQAIVPVRDSGEPPAFTLTSVPDGEYCVSGLLLSNNDVQASSTCLKITVKGADVTGADIVMVPLASISGKLSLEQATARNTGPDCKPSNPTAAPSPATKGRSASVRAPAADAQISDSVIWVAPDKAPGEGSASAVLGVFNRAAIPDGNGDFRIAKVIAGRYQLEINLPSKDWYLAGVTRPAAEGKPKLIGDDLALKPGENLAGLSISVRRGAAAVNGRIVAGSDGSRLPPLLRVYLIPLDKAEKSGPVAQASGLASSESERTPSQPVMRPSHPDAAGQPLASDVPVAFRYREAEVQSDGSFVLTNLAPGRYKLIGMPRTKDETARSDRPLTRSAEGRARLLRESRNHGTELDLGPCGIAAGVVLKY
jgi:hypothetical protein